MNTLIKIALMLFVSVAAISGCGNSGPQSGGNHEAQREAKTLGDWAQTLRGRSLDDIIQIMGRPDEASEDDPVPGTGGLVRWTSVVYKGRVLDTITGRTEDLHISLSYKQAAAIRIGYSGRVINL